MAKKVSKKPSKKKTADKLRRRFDVADYGIDLQEIIEQIRPHLQGTRREIGERAGGMPFNNVNRLLNGQLKPSLGALAALAHASGGRLVVSYEPPRKAIRKRKASK